MPWIVLIVSAVLESVWATALGRSEGFTVLTATIVFAVALAASMGTLAWAARHIPIGTAYAVWTGLGAALTVLIAIASGDETASVLKVLFLLGIVAAVVGLKLAPAKAPADAGSRATDDA